MALAISKETQIKRARLYPDVIRLHLDEAKLCANCDTIHTGSSCPTCASSNSLLLSSVIGRMPQDLSWKGNGFSKCHSAAQVTRSGSLTASSSVAEKRFSLLQHMLHLVGCLR